MDSSPGQSNVSEWRDMSTIGRLVQYTIVALSKANYECWSNTKRKLVISHQNVFAMIDLKN